MVFKKCAKIQSPPLVAEGSENFLYLKNYFFSGATAPLEQQEPLEPLAHLVGSAAGAAPVVDVAADFLQQASLVHFSFFLPLPLSWSKANADVLRNDANAIINNAFFMCDNF